MSNLSTTTALTTYLPIISKPIIAYVLPAFGVIGLIGNLAIIYGMSRVKNVFNASLRFYYIVLAVAEFIDVSYFLGAEFYEYGLWLLTGGSWKNLFYNSSTLSCKIIQALWIGSDTVAGFTVLCLGVERCIAVTWPLQAKRFLTFQFSVLLETAVCFVFLLSLEPLLLVVYDLYQVPFYWAPVCLWNYSLDVTAVYMVIEQLVPILYTAIAFLITAYLSATILRTTRARRRLTQRFDQNGAADRAAGKLSAREISNVVTLIVLSAVHLAIYMPSSFLYLFYIVLSQTAPFDGFTLVVLNLTQIFKQLTLLPHAINVFVYLFRSRAFRVALFGVGCAGAGHSEAFKSTHQ